MQTLPVLAAVAALLLLCALTVPAEDTSTCTYTFTVPHPPGDQCGDDLHDQLEELQDELKKLENRVKDLENGIDCAGKPDNGTGPTYIRWGRTVCPRGSTTLYHGFSSGSARGHRGGAGQYVCLPTDPEYGDYAEGVQGGSYLYGSQYKLLPGQDPFQRTNTNNQSVLDYGVPCAHCMATEKWAVDTFPAWRTCPHGWKREYQGYLMTSRYNDYGGVQPACVDEAPEVLPERISYTYESHLYLEEATCGSLPCPSYHAGWELTCSVCSK